MDSSVNSPSIGGVGGAGGAGGSARHVLVVCNDLYFRVHLESQVRAAGLLAVPIASLPALDAVPGRAELTVRGAVVDLQWNGGDPIEAVRRLSGMTPTFPVLAFGPHVNRDQLMAARTAGAVAMPRSRFARVYPEFLEALSLGLPWPSAETAAEPIDSE